MNTPKVIGKVGDYFVWSQVREQGITYYNVTKDRANAPHCAYKHLDVLLGVKGFPPHTKVVDVA